MARAVSSRRGKPRKKARGFNPMPLLITLLFFALLGYLFLSVHGPILIHLW